MAVLDASVVVEYLTDGPGAQAARGRVNAHLGDLHAPHLLDAEVGHVLRRLALRGDLAHGAARSALEDLAAFPLARIDHAVLLDRAWALRRNLSFYDGLYVALAELLEAPLLTFDARIAAAPGLRAEVEVIA